MAFAYAKQKNPRLKLWIMGPADEDETYASECFRLVGDMQIKDIVFTGRVQVKDYIGKMDFTILTSVSEGQPLTILESFAAHRPVIATDVGNCKGLLLGESDDFGEAGILTHIMNIEEMCSALSISKKTGYKLLREGKIVGMKVGRTYRVPKVHVLSYLKIVDENPAK